METLFWCFLIGGALFTIVTVFIGDVLGDWFKPIVVAGAGTAFGGAGILLLKYTALGNGAVFAISLLIAVAAALLVLFGFVFPAANSEVSMGFSMQELEGKIGEVTIPVPETGYGEVMIKLGAANTIHTASSFDGMPLSAGTRIVVVKVSDGVVRVSDLEM
ncbi:protease [Paenibacillus medicaginis]|uniref:Protease n=1 Tax=Paenibacillus medicaginis TaxID=1470560 RepID=A0ABV5C3U8_9BACL